MCVRLLRMAFERFTFAFEWLESLSNASNLHSNGLNPFRMVQICIHCLESFRMLQSSIRMVRIPFEWSNFHSIASNLVRLVRICIRMVRISFEWFKFARDWSNRVRMLRFCIRILRISFECFEFCIWICIWMVRIPFELFELAFVWFDV